MGVVRKTILSEPMVVVFRLISNDGSCLSLPVAGVEVELLPEAAPVVVWRLVDAIEKHGEKVQA